MTKALAGIRVLDFTHVLAGPFATRILGDMGADVVKVSTGEREIGSADGAHPYYLMWNRNKRSLALNMANPEARPFARRLCEKADIVIDNFSVGVLDRWGLGYDAVAEKNAGVIYIQMSGMGDGGPWSNYVTYAPTVHALAGLTHLTGIPGREDIGIGFSYNDHLSGLHGATAALVALEARRASGRGQRIDIAQFEIGVGFGGPSLLDFFAGGRAARPVGNRLPYDVAAPHNCYPCAGARSEAVEDERWVAIACMDEDQWRGLCRVMGEPAWTHDKRFATAAGRAANVDELDELIAAWTGERMASEVMQVCQAEGVPAGVVQNGADLAEHDPHVAAAGFLHRFSDPHPAGVEVFADLLPLRFGETPADEYRRPSALGEDNVTVLEDWLGLSRAEVEQGQLDGRFV